MPSAVALGSSLLDVARRVVAPPRCAACDVRVGAAVAFCPPCAATVERGAPPVVGGWAPFVYGGSLATAIARFKYGDRPDLARPLGRLLASELVSPRGPRAEAAPSFVVAVPLHARRLVDRGYDVASLLGVAVARARGVPFRTGILTRVRPTPHQAGLPWESRVRNVRGAFACADPARVRGARVWIVDDVRTTGATLSACVAALRLAGARAVFAVVLAKTDGGGPR